MLHAKILSQLPLKQKKPDSEKTLKTLLGLFQSMIQPLTQVPYGIPSDTKVLYLQDNEIINSVELNERLSNLPILEKVMLYKNGKKLLI